MKKIILAFALFTALTSSVFAFIPEMSFFVNREVATARVFNTSNRTYVCSGTAFGRTYSGLVLNAWFNQIIIAPGMYADTYVYTNYYDPFFTAWAEVNCQYIY